MHAAKCWGCYAQEMPAGQTLGNATAIYEGGAGMTRSKVQMLLVAKQSHTMCAGLLPPTSSRSTHEGSEESGAALASPNSHAGIKVTVAWNATH